ncbi:MAG: DUF4349 domain-containing protein [Candidatus Dojkabacteria bacterium]
MKNDIANLFEQYSGEIKPSAAAEERVYANISQRLRDRQSSLFFKFKMMRYKLFSLKTGVILAPIIFALGAVMLLLPTLYMGAQLGYVPDLARNSATDLGTPDTEKFGIGSERAGEKPVTSEGMLFDGSDNDLYPIPPQQEKEDTDTPETSRAKEQTAYFVLESSDVNSSYESVRSLASTLEGYIKSVNLEGGKKKTAYITLRLPAEKFELALGKLRDMDVEIVSESISTVDRQNELTEITDSRKALQDQIKEIEKKLAGNPKDSERQTLKFQLEVAKDDLEYYNSQMEGVKTDTQYSTLTVTIQQAKLGSIFGNLEDGVNNAVIFWAQVFAWILIPVGFALPVVVVVLVLYKLLRRRK